MASQLDPGQIVKRAFDDNTDALKIKQIAGGLITEPYDSIALTYVPSGNGAGSIQTVTYYSGGLTGTVVGTLTLSYDAQNRISSVVKS